MSVAIDDQNPIVWRLRLSSTPERVFSAWLTPADHIRFWAERSEPHAEGFRLHFIDGTVHVCQVRNRVNPSHIRMLYFGSRVDITLSRRDNGTDLTLTASDVPVAEWQDVYAGWLNVLLPFKAWVDFGIDIRSHDPARTWQQRYVDQ